MTEYATGGIVSTGQTYVVGVSGCVYAFPKRRRNTRYYVGEDGPEEIIQVAVDVGRVGVDIDVSPVVHATAERLDQPRELTE